jgi:hypothetical protein
VQEICNNSVSAANSKICNNYTKTYVTTIQKCVTTIQKSVTTIQKSVTTIQKCVTDCDWSKDSSFHL